MIHLFHCVNCLTDSEVQSLRTRFGDGLETLSLPCSGKMTIPYLLKAFEAGADAVVVCSCPVTECRNLEGNLRASKRAQAVDELLQEVGLGAGRVLMIAKSAGDLASAVGGIEGLLAELQVAGVGQVTEPARATLMDVRSGSQARRRRENAA
jgi:F420-non-reducing hydrogenase iron-sulfur subunit